MKIKKMNLLSVSAGLILLSSSSTVWAGDWLWPLYVRDTSGAAIQAGEPRPAIWGTMGEYQSYNGTIYGHPGHDIRGDIGDVVLLPANATIERVYFNHPSCNDMNRYSCRMWFLDETGQNLFYMSHVDTRPDPISGDILEVSMEVRSAFEAATLSGSPAADRRLVRGTKLAPLADFPSDWHHLHLGIFNIASGYQMQNTIEFLDANASGQTGESLLAVDDEAPLIESISLVENEDDVSAISSGTCGEQIDGPVDIVADMYDTYYTNGSFANFPGKGVLDPNTGLRRAFFEVKNASGALVDSGTWYDIVGLPISCTTLAEAGTPLATSRATSYSCLDAGTETSTTLSQFFARMENEDGAPSTGLSVLDYLFDTVNSKSDYAVAGGESYIHIVTNQGGTDGVFDPTGLPDGRYQFTVIAEDFTGRKASRSRFVNYAASGTLSTSAAGLRDLYTRDRIADIGTLPSNPGGEPFWQSPDIFVVPAGSPEPDLNSNAVSTVVVEGGDYDVYLRVTNPTCNAVTLSGVRIVSADPSAINSVWTEVTTGSGYVGDPDDGNTVSPNSSRFFGPYRWIPSAEETGADGHRCLLAGFSSSDDPVGDFFDAPGQNNVAQRNMNINGCNFELPNNGSAPVNYNLRITTDANVGGSDVIELVLPHIDFWYADWSMLPEVTMSSDGSFMRARLKSQDVTLPANGILAGAVIPVSFAFSLPSGTPLRTVNLEPILSGTTLGGMSCSASGGPIIR